jgi:hypothetical protein
MINGLGCLLLRRVVLPGYDFLAQYKASALFIRARQVFRPDLFAELEKAGPGRGMHTTHIQDGIRAITKIVLHTGRDVDQLTAEDIYQYRERFHRGSRSGDRSVHAGWELLQGIGVLPSDKSLRAALTTGQRTTEQLVDAYQIRSQPVRGLLDPIGRRLHYVCQQAKGAGTAPAVLRLADSFDAATLHRYNITAAKDDSVTRTEKILKFFGVANPEAFEQTWIQPRVSFRRSHAFTVAEQNTALWLRLVDLSAQQINTGPLRARILRNVVRTLPAMTNLSIA